MALPLESTFADQLPGLYEEAPPRGFTKPEVLVFNQSLAEELGLESTRERAAAYYSGNELLPGSRPIALAYAGHQFGSFNPQLGDGRAVLLGETRSQQGQLFDLQLKGSGPTRFSRGGDGKAGLGPVLRETLVSEAMYHLGVPTTRVLCALSTGEPVQRETLLPGAVLCRTAASHLRIGSAQYLAQRSMLELSEKMVKYALVRHYPDTPPTSSPALSLLSAVGRAQARLIAHWMSLGFIHGVMNTDNVALSGETIDYGPCAFMDTYDQDTVFSSIDRGGRYAYKNQPLIGKWNLARLAEALLPQLADREEEAIEIAQGQLGAYEDYYNEQLLDRMRGKLGLVGKEDSDRELIADVLTYLYESNADFTQSFRSMASDLNDYNAPQWGPMGQEVAERYVDRLKGEAGSSVAERMNHTNPIYIPRNHLVERVLASAHRGDLAPFFEMTRVLAQPFEERPGYEQYATPAPADFGPYRTFCGT